METIIKSILLAWFITSNDYIQESIHTWFKYYRDSRNPFVLDIIYDIITCPWCLGLCITLFWSLNPWHALLSSIILYTYTKIIK